MNRIAFSKQLVPFYWVLGIVLLAQTSCVHRAPVNFSHEVETAEKPWTHEAFKNDPDEFQFAILTDRTGGAREGVFASAVKKMNSIQPEFVVSVGDYIQGYTPDEAQLVKEWDHMEGIFEGFEMPFFLLPGNHDLSNAPMQPIYEQRFGKRYYSFLYNDVLFLCLDTQDKPIASNKPIIGDAGLLPEQVDWALGVLAANPDVRWTFVLMHQPLWLYEDKIADAGSRHPVTGKVTGWNPIEEALQGRDFSVFAGHLHRYTKYVRENRNYYVLATTGGGSALRGPAYGEFDHAVWVTMTHHGPKLANLLLDGIVGDDIHTEKTIAFRDSLRLKYALDEAASSITGQLNVKNTFHHDLEIEELWTKSTGSGWRTESTIGADHLLPGEEKTYQVVFHLEEGVKFSDVPRLSLACAAGSELNGTIELNSPLRAYLKARRPQIKIPTLADAPVIDGVIGKVEWAGATVAPRLVKLETPEPARDQATVWYAYDSENLYLAANLIQDPGALRVKSLKAEDPLWEDDSVELFFDGNLDGETYSQAIVTASNVRKGFDLENFDSGTGRTEDAWTFEMKVSWKDLGVPVPEKGFRFGFNLRRNCAAGGGRRVSEWTSTLSGHPHAVDLFGILELE